ncbi:hypothetical protein M5K25_027033 [Dendrobium thyrsiflorum]|uniref:Uncharacterized protein n=1 Tax=Dendrobium thyrsiflorum TaxID=117978 RepID=A0ABD0TYZ0_DENTH
MSRDLRDVNSDCSGISCGFPGDLGGISADTRTCRFSMDPASPEKEPSEESTRELLIGISQLVPEKFVQPELVSNSAAAAANLGVADGGAVEEHRSKLISISYTQSPDPESPEFENAN